MIPLAFYDIAVIAAIVALHEGLGPDHVHLGIERSGGRDLICWFFNGRGGGT